MNINTKTKNPDKRNQEEYQALKKIVEVARHTIEFKSKSQIVDEALNSEDREKMIDTLTKHIKKYENLINALAPITQRYVMYIENYYEDKTIDDIKNDLYFIRNIILADVIGRYGLEKKAERVLNNIAARY